MRRFPVEPLLRLVNKPTVNGDNTVSVERILGDILAQECRIAGRGGYQAVWRAKRFGLTATQADRFATALGHHPGEIWDEWWRDT